MSTQTLAYGNIVNTNTLYPSALLLILGIGTCVFTMFPCASETGSCLRASCSRADGEEVLVAKQGFGRKGIRVHARKYRRERWPIVGLVVSIDGVFSEVAPGVKGDDLWLDEDEEQGRLVQQRKLRFQLASMRPADDEEGHADFTNRLDEERVRLRTRATGTIQVEVKEGAGGVASRRHYRKALWSTPTAFCVKGKASFSWRTGTYGRSADASSRKEQGDI